MRFWVGFKRTAPWVIGWFFLIAGVTSRDAYSLVAAVVVFSLLTVLAAFGLSIYSTPGRHRK